MLERLEEVVGVVVETVADDGKLKRLVAGGDAVCPTRAAGDGDRDPLPKPRQTTCCTDKWERSSVARVFLLLWVMLGRGQL